MYHEDNLQDGEIIFTKDKLHENACQCLKMHPDRLKVHQITFGSWAPPGPAGGA